MIIRALFLIFALGLGWSEAASNCELVFKACPKDLNNLTLTVPRNVIWLHPVLPACDESTTQSIPAVGEMPSIVFIIDNSGSMSKGEVNTSDDGNDPEEARFTVVTSLLDTLRAALPQARVGLVVFTRRLAWDHRDNDYFRTAFPNDTSQHDSFAPLTALDTVFPNGVTGADTLKRLLAFHGNGNLDSHTKRPGSRPNESYGPTSTRDGTDISLGFQAAKVAMAQSKASRENQIFIFLSDGDATSLDSGRAEFKNEYQTGKETPTTFTVYFKEGSDNPAAPNNIVKMTQAIQGNGYSANNPKSAAWAINLPAKQLFDLLQGQVLAPILKRVPYQPLQASVAVNGQAPLATTLTASGYQLPKRIPLTKDMQSVDFTATYRAPDSLGMPDKSVHYTVKLNRTGDAGSLPSGLATQCEESAVLTLHSQGQAISRVGDADNPLEVRLSRANQPACVGCSVHLAATQTQDAERLPLLPKEGYAASTFAHVTRLTASPGNDALEHLAADSIVLLYLNPENALDTARRSYPVETTQSFLSVRYHNDIARPVSGLATHGKAWVLVAPGGAASLVQNQACCRVQATPMNAADSAGHVGIHIEVTQPVRVELTVFSNLGEKVNAVAIDIDPNLFAQLQDGTAPGSKRLRLLWNGQSQDGRAAATGAFILRTQVSELVTMGAPASLAPFSQYRRIGVIRQSL